MTADLSQDEFQSTLKSAVAGASSSGIDSVSGNDAPAQPAASSEAAVSSTGDSAIAEGSDDGVYMNPRVRDVLAERQQRLAADKQSKDAAEKAHGKARADARRAESETGVSSSGRRTSQTSQANQVRKAQEEARKERERILQNIENDKQARREREREHRRQRSESEEQPTQHKSRDSIGSASGTGSGTGMRRPSAMKECALQIRLFDGSTIRERFSAWKTIRTHVRPWIDRQRKAGDDTPYTFRQVLVPMPNRVIEIAEEDEDLESLGLCPSATLIMVPIKGYTNAYDQPGGSHALAKGVSAGYNIVSGGAGMLSGAIASLFGYGTRDPPLDSRTSAAGSRAGGSARRAEGDDEQESGEDQHLYTGNGVSDS